MNTHLSKLPALCIVVAGAGIAAHAQAQDILARVISSTPVVTQVAVPQQVCQNQPVVTQAPGSGAGAVMGALAGGALGNAVGDGSGRALATVIGLVGGAMAGNNIEGGRSQVQNVQQCGTQMSYENRTTHYDVVYEYADKRHNVRMPQDPGLYVRLQVTPVGALPPQGYGQAQPQYQQQYQQPYQQYQQQYQQQSAPVYVQPPMYVQQAPLVMYPGGFPQAQPYYRPALPIGLSFNFGYVHRSGGHRHRHWR